MIDLVDDTINFIREQRTFGLYGAIKIQQSLRTDDNSVFIANWDSHLLVPRQQRTMRFR